MIKLLDDKLNSKGYDFNSHSKISEITDVFEFISFIMACEIYYNLEIFDDEAEFIEVKDLSFLDIEDLFIFLRDGYATDSIHKLIVDNIDWLSRIRPDYRRYLANRRDDRINSIFN
jgi:hypothetical protein